MRSCPKHGVNLTIINGIWQCSKCVEKRHEDLERYRRKRNEEK